MIEVLKSLTMSNKQGILPMIINIVIIHMIMITGELATNGYKKSRISLHL